MQRLNLRTPRHFDPNREFQVRKPRARFFCVSEGPTEESYFQGIRNNKRELGIKNDVFIEIIPKKEGQEGYSHPQQLVNACLYEMGRIDEDGQELPIEKWEENCKWDFDPELDLACVIFDRDYRDLENCLDKLLTLCQKHGIFMAISNPNFELWLLMHFPNILQYDRELLHKNPKNLRGQWFPEASVHKKYLEIILSTAANGYTKGRKIKFQEFLPHIPLALEQIRLFCEEPKRLCDEPGSSVGKLIRKMKSTGNV